MLRRLQSDESGVALGLAVILVLIIGVMGAGFLALVRNDLEAAISANRGQRAFNLADAGAQAAAVQLRSDATPEHYDANAAENSGWAQVSPDGGTPGKTLSLEGGSARVTIRYLIPPAEPEQTEDEHHAPEPVPEGLDDYPDRDYFAAVSEGTSGGTRRKVEVIFRIIASGDSREVEQWCWREAYE